MTAIHSFLPPHGIDGENLVWLTFVALATGRERFAKRGEATFPRRRREEDDLLERRRRRRHPSCVVGRLHDLSPFDGD